MMEATLCLLLKPGEILLAMKKRGFGVGRWNGTGGRFKPEIDKTILDAATRETKEEIGVEIKNPEQVGVLRFRFSYKPEWDQDVHLFLAKEWQGEPQESEEMMPKWFKFHEIPYDKMWDDDKFWMPHVLRGEKLDADFVFKEGPGQTPIVEKYNIKVLEMLKI